MVKLVNLKTSANREATRLSIPSFSSIFFFLVLILCLCEFVGFSMFNDGFDDFQSVLEVGKVW